MIKVTPITTTIPTPLPRKPTTIKIVAATIQTVSIWITLPMTTKTIQKVIQQQLHMVTKTVTKLSTATQTVVAIIRKV